MLKKFFLTQWYQPCEGDWTETVKQNLEEFNIPCNFESIKSKSRESFKRLVKIRAKEYALLELTRKQEKTFKNGQLVLSLVEVSRVPDLSKH